MDIDLTITIVLGPEVANSLDLVSTAEKMLEMSMSEPAVRAFAVSIATAFPPVSRKRDCPPWPRSVPKLCIQNPLCGILRLFLELLRAQADPRNKGVYRGGVLYCNWPGSEPDCLILAFCFGTCEAVWSKHCGFESQDPAFSAHLSRGLNRSLSHPVPFVKHIISDGEAKYEKILQSQQGHPTKWTHANHNSESNLTAFWDKQLQETNNLTSASAVLILDVSMPDCARPGPAHGRGSTSKALVVDGEVQGTVSRLLPFAVGCEKEVALSVWQAARDARERHVDTPIAGVSPLSAIAAFYTCLLGDPDHIGVECGTKLFALLPWNAFVHLMTGQSTQASLSELGICHSSPVISLSPERTAAPFLRGHRVGPRLPQMPRHPSLFRNLQRRDWQETQRVRSVAQLSEEGGHERWYCQLRNLVVNEELFSKTISYTKNHGLWMIFNVIELQPFGGMMLNRAKWVVTHVQPMDLQKYFSDDAMPIPMSAVICRACPELCLHKLYVSALFANQMIPEAADLALSDDLNDAPSVVILNSQRQFAVTVALQFSASSTGVSFVTIEARPLAPKQDEAVDARETCYRLRCFGPYGHGNKKQIKAHQAAMWQSRKATQPNRSCACVKFATDQVRRGPYHTLPSVSTPRSWKRRFLNGAVPKRNGS